MTWYLVGPRIGERETAAEPLGHVRNTGALREGIVLAEEGPGRAGAGTATPRTKVKVLLGRPDGKGKPRRFGTFGGMRQWTEPVNNVSSWTVRPGTPRRSHRAGGLHPCCPVAAGPGRVYLAQLADRRGRQAVPNRLRPLGPDHWTMRIHSPSEKEEKVLC